MKSGPARTALYGVIATIAGGVSVYNFKHGWFFTGGLWATTWVLMVVDYAKGE